MGGLAYDLTTQNLPQYNNFSEMLYDSYLNSDNNNLVELWSGIFAGTPGGASAEDVIIRGTRFANDWYYIYGSYRAFFMGLYGDPAIPANNGIAWDGFVMLIPAHAMFSRFPENFPGGVVGVDPAENEFDFNNPNIFNSTNSVYAFPMRLPYKLPPGVVGDAVAIAADSEVGVHCLDYALGTDRLNTAPAPLPSFPNRRVAIDPRNEPCLNFTWMGHQRTYAGNGTLDMDYIGCGGIIEATVELPAYGSAANPVGSQETVSYFVAEDFGWNRDEAACRNGPFGPLGSVTNFPAPERISILQDRTAYFSRDSTTTDIATVLLSGFAQPAATTSGYYLSRIYDIASYVGFAGLNGDAGLALVVGEASRINAAGTAVAGTVPFSATWKPATSTFTELAYLNSTPRDRMSFKVGVPPLWVTDNSIAAIDFDGAWANTISPSLGRSLIDPGPDAFPTSFLVGINNLEIGGVKTCAVYGAATELVLYGGGYERFTAGEVYVDSLCLVPIAIKGNNFTTLTGIELPEGTGAKWTGRAQQQQTFSPAYEELTKGTQSYLNKEDFGYIVDPDLLRSLTRDATISPEDREVSALVGCFPKIGQIIDEQEGTGNIYLGGLSNKPPPTITNPYSNLGYGLMAFVPGGEPYVFMYDYGTVSVLQINFGPGLFPIAPAMPEFNIRAAGLQEGDNMNAAFTVSPTSTTRYPISASWDNDRDQWIFTFADAVNGFGFMSVNSAFSTAEDKNQFTFLDQSNNFAIPATLAAVDPNPEGCIYTSRMMTPILDGLAIIGTSNDNTGKGQRALRPFVVPQAFGPDQTHFAVYNINGTTGRSANVWVDYLLFDGVDSLIASELQTMGLRVTVENVEWYKAKIIRKGELGFTPEEIEDWVRSQQEEYKATQRLKQRQGRSRLRKRQVQAWQEGNNDMEDIVSGDFTEKGGFDSLKDFDKAAKDYVPDPSEASPDSSRKEKNNSGKR